MALDVTKGTSLKMIYDGQNSLSYGKFIHNEIGFQNLLNEIHSLPKDIMFLFELIETFSK